MKRLPMSVPVWKMQQISIRKNKEAALTEQAGCCKYCFEPIKVSKATADHRKAKKNGGGNGKENIDAVCFDCNQLKGHKTAGDFLKLIKAPPVDSSLSMLLAASRRRIWLKTHRAVRNIARASGIEVSSPIGGKWERENERSNRQAR